MTEVDENKVYSEFGWGRQYWQFRRCVAFLEEHREQLRAEVPDKPYVAILYRPLGDGGPIYIGRSSDEFRLAEQAEKVYPHQSPFVLITHVDEDHSKIEDLPSPEFEEPLDEQLTAERAVI